jgi:hypothetical protein
MWGAPRSPLMNSGSYERAVTCATPTGSAGHAGATANLKLISTWTTQRGLITAAVGHVDHFNPTHHLEQLASHV